MRLAFLFRRRSTTFQAKKRTIEKGTVDRSGHMTPDAVKLVEKDIVGNDLVSDG